MKGQGIATAIKAAALMVWLAASPALQAQPASFPSKPIRVIVPYSPGGPVDLAARPLTTKLTDSLGISVLIDFKPGASSAIGTDYVAKSPPDGYTLVWVSSPTIPATIKNLPFDMVKDFAAVSNAAQSGLILVSNPALKINSVAELVTYGKSRPNGLAFGSSGAGGAAHLAAEYFCLTAGIKWLHVPFKGTGPALQDVMAGRLDFTVAGLSGAAPFIKTGKLKAVAYGGAKRSRLMPDIPTVAESSAVFEKYAVGSSYAVLAPARTPSAVILRLNSEMKKALATAEIEGIYTRLGIEPWWTSPEDAGAWVREEIAKWIAVAKAINYQPE